MSQTPAASRPNARVPLRSLFAGTIACVVLYAAMKAIRVWELPIGRYGKLTISLSIFFLVGLAIGRMVVRERSPHTRRLATAGFGAALIGIALGVVFWNGLEDLVFSHIGSYPIYQERRLFPVDVALLWMYATLPMLTGLLVGVIWRRERQLP